MGIEKPQQPGSAQRDLFEETVSPTENTDTVPGFTELCDTFYALTGYKASAYSFTSKEDDLNKLRQVVDELALTPENDRNAYLMGLAAEIEAGTKWWMK